MTPKRRQYLIEQCHDDSISLQTALKLGKLIPSLGVAIKMYKIMEEILRVCPVEPG